MPHICTPEWKDRLGEVASFLLAHDCLPTRDGDSDASFLANWLNHQRTAYNDGRLVPEQIALLEATGIPQTGWLNGDRERRLDAVWFENLRLVREYMDHHGRRPAVRSGDGSERRLANWLQTQNWRESKMPEHRRVAFASAILDATPGRRSPREDAVWQGRLDEVVVFAKNHGARPTHNATDPDEKRLGQWLAKQRVRIGRGTLPHDRQAQLDAACDLTGVNLIARTGRRKADADVPARIAAFHATHGRLPDISEQDGAWLRRARSRHHEGRMSSRLRDALDAIDPDWSSTTPRAARTQEAISDLVDFVTTHKRLPSKAKPTSSRELRLAILVANARSRDQRGELSDYARTLLDAHVPGWSDAVALLAKFEHHAQALAALGAESRPRSRDPLYRWRRKVLQGIRRETLSPDRLAIIELHTPWLIEEAACD